MSKVSRQNPFFKIKFLEEKNNLVDSLSCARSFIPPTEHQKAKSPPLTQNPLCVFFFLFFGAKSNGWLQDAPYHSTSNCASKKMKRDTDWFFSDPESMREHKMTEKDSKKSDMKKTSPTASSHSELILLILLRSYHSPKAIEKKFWTAPTRNSCHRTQKKPLCAVARVSTSPDSNPTRGEKIQFHNIIRPSTHPPHGSLIRLLFVVFFILLDERKLLGLFCHQNSSVGFEVWPSTKPG